jgi:hypothetical protein
MLTVFSPLDPIDAFSVIHSAKVWQDSVNREIAAIAAAKGR